MVLDVITVPDLHKNVITGRSGNFVTLVQESFILISMPTKRIMESVK